MRFLFCKNVAKFIVVFEVELNNIPDAKFVYGIVSQNW